MNQRICTNYGHCVAADRREIFSVEEGGKTHCPLCQNQLSEVLVPQEPKKKTNPLLLVAVAAATLILSAALVTGMRWVNSSHGNKVAVLNEAHTSILRLAGSNTIGDTLAPSLAEAFLKNQGATNLQILPGDKADEKIVLGVLPGDKQPSSIEIAAHGSATAFTTMEANNCDIGMASRRIKPDEANKLMPMGNMLLAGSEHILGLDGIAVIVNASNPISELSADQIKQIFAGTITDWSQLGPVHGAINIYARNNNSGTYDTFKSLVLAASPLASSARRFEDSNALSQAVSSDPNGIGFIGLPFVHSAKALAVSQKGTGSLQPTRLTVATEDYALSRRLYLYTPENPTNKYTQKFVEFALSQQGQNLVASNGFIAQNVVPESQTVAETAPAGYKQLTRNAERLPLDFRFQAGQSIQDNKAQADLDRVVALIADRKVSGDKIMLFGFADNVGSPEANQALSLGRAKIIENQFIQRGVKPAVVIGFGSILPIAPNDTNEGREKNRRVEIWLKK